MSGATLTLEHVTKVASGRRILSDVTAEIAAGQTVAVIGPSGAGKSTLLRCINQLDSPTSGRVLLDGKEISGGTLSRRDKSAVHRRIGLVFQNFALFPHLTARANIELAQVRALGRTRSAARSRADELLDSVGLGGRGDSRPHQMSGGEQQRAAIARALALDPQVLLLDEPTSAIDPERRREVLDVIRGVADSGVTIVLTTHEMKFAETAADRVIFLAEGSVLEDGEARQVMRDPGHERTRTFLAAVMDE